VAEQRWSHHGSQIEWRERERQTGRGQGQDVPSMTQPQWPTSPHILIAI
jgi:hypothetical protein